MNEVLGQNAEALYGAIHKGFQLLRTDRDNKSYSLKSTAEYPGKVAQGMLREMRGPSSYRPKLMSMVFVQALFVNLPV